MTDGRDLVAMTFCLTARFTDSWRGAMQGRGYQAAKDWEPSALVNWSGAAALPKYMAHRKRTAEDKSCMGATFPIGSAGITHDSASDMSAMTLSEQALDQSHPAFLDLLETDYEKAVRQFADFAYRLLEIRPPRILASQPETDRKELIQRAILHFIDDRSRVLRKYVDRGQPFRHWFLTVAANKMLEIIRGESRLYARFVDSQPDCPATDSPGNNPGPAELLADREFMKAVSVFAGELRVKCQILIRAFYHGRSYEEMAILIGIDPKENQKISNDLKYCLKTLRKNLVAAGFAFSDFQ